MKKSTKKTYSRGDVLKVTWIDAFSRDGWQNGPGKKEAVVTDPLTVLSIGQFLGSEKNYFMLAMSQHDNWERVGDVLSIPHGMIKKVEKIG